MPIYGHMAEVCVVCSYMSYMPIYGHMVKVCVVHMAEVCVVTWSYMPIYGHMAEVCVVTVHGHIWVYPCMAEVFACIYTFIKKNLL